jgi:hypothetical protein
MTPLIYLLNFSSDKYTLARVVHVNGRVIASEVLGLQLSPPSHRPRMARRAVREIGIERRSGAREAVVGLREMIDPDRRVTEVGQELGAGAATTL